MANYIEREAESFQKYSLHSQRRIAQRYYIKLLQNNRGGGGGAKPQNNICGFWLFFLSSSKGFTKQIWRMTNATVSFGLQPWKQFIIRNLYSGGLYWTGDDLMNIINNNNAFNSYSSFQGTQRHYLKYLKDPKSSNYN